MFSAPRGIGIRPDLSEFSQIDLLDPAGFSASEGPDWRTYLAAFCMAADTRGLWDQILFYAKACDALAVIQDPDIQKIEGRGLQVTYSRIKDTIISVVSKSLPEAIFLDWETQAELMDCLREISKLGYKEFFSKHAIKEKQKELFSEHALRIK